MGADAARARLRELSDFAAPWAVWVAATLRLPDHVRDGARSVDALAERAGADADALRRLMRYLVARGVFAEDDGGYANTELSELLLDEAGMRTWFDLDGAPGIWAQSWGRLLTATRTGSPGRDEGWFYAELERTGRGASFDAQMAVEARENAETIAAAYDWSGVASLVDVGGGTGTLARVVLDAQPHLHATLVDLPQVVAAVPPHERLDVVGGDLFTDPLPRGDVYALSRILHGWPDAQAVRILGRCLEAGGEEARILVVEGLLDDRPSADEASFDLFMLTLAGGRQRTADELGRLGAACGLALRSTVTLPGGNTLLELVAQ